MPGDLVVVRMLAVMVGVCEVGSRQGVFANEPSPRVFDLAAKRGVTPTCRIRNGSLFEMLLLFHHHGKHGNSAAITSCYPYE